MKQPSWWLVWVGLTIGAGLSTGIGASGTWADQSEQEARSVVASFYQDLSRVMRGSHDFAERYRLLAPVVERTFDLQRMTQLTVGRSRWRQLSGQQRRQLYGLFARLVTSHYTHNFRRYQGERLEVLRVHQSSRGRLIVATRIVPTDREPVAIDYVMHRNRADNWQVLDIYLDRTISQVAIYRAEFGSVLRREGIGGLVDQIQTTIAQLETP